MISPTMPKSKEFGQKTQEFQGLTGFLRGYFNLNQSSDYGS
jgi:hypothetical protein